MVDTKKVGEDLGEAAKTIYAPLEQKYDAEGVQLPQWQSHKKVWGDKIIEIYSDVADREGADDSGVRWLLDCGALITVSLQLKNRVPVGVDPVGGYYVRYKDNFESWSPAKAFEEGYMESHVVRPGPTSSGG